MRRLNRCPQCKSALVICEKIPLLPAAAKEGDIWYAECIHCGHVGPDAATQETARQLWNRQEIPK